MINSFDNTLFNIKERISKLSFFVTINIATEVALIVDHSIKTKEHPENVISRLKIINQRLDLLEKYEREDYFINYNNCEKDNNKEIDWEKPRQSFDFMWPKTTFETKTFKKSCEGAMQRFSQILNIVNNSNINLNSFLDIGCGPGRYLYAAKQILGEIELTGLDTGQNILKQNWQKDELKKINFFLDDVMCKKIDKKYSFVMCNGVAHHTGIKLNKIIKRHSELVSENGIYFIFVYGYGGFELKTWKFLQDTIGNYDKKEVFNFWSAFINPLRVQGLMDHTYGLFYETKRKDIELLLNTNFKSYERVSGIYGLDVT